MAEANHKAMLAQQGVSAAQADEFEQKAQALGLSINWQALLALVQQFGPAILTAILSLFVKQPTPPGPQPAQS